MFLLKCPHCGDRDISEFSCGGEAHIARPLNSEKLNDAEWADYLFMRTNVKGQYAERWNHAAGCRKWFNVIRNTATDQILDVYKMGEKMPKVKTNNPTTPSGEAPIGSGNDAVKIAKASEFNS